MPEKMFFARLAPVFAQHEGSARRTADKHDDVKRLITTAEYECLQLRRALRDLVAEFDVPAPRAEPAPLCRSAMDALHDVLQADEAAEVAA